MSEFVVSHVRGRSASVEIAPACGDRRRSGRRSSSRVGRRSEGGHDRLRLPALLRLGTWRGVWVERAAWQVSGGDGALALLGSPSEYLQAEYTALLGHGAFAVDTSGGYSARSQRCGLSRSADRSLQTGRV